MVRERHRFSGTVRRALCSPAPMVVVAFLLRMAVLFSNQMSLPPPPLNYFPFPGEEAAIARSIFTGKGFSSPLGVESGPTAYLAPLYPYLMAGVFRFFGNSTYRSLLVLLTMNCAFAALTCIPIYYIGRRAFAESAGVGAGWLWAVLPMGFKFDTRWVWDTSLVTLLFALLFWATLALRRLDRLPAWAGYGALWALACLTNAAVFSLWPFFLAWLAFELHKKKLNWVRPIGTSVLVFALGIAPWMIRNYLVFGRIIPFRSTFGPNLYLGNNPIAPSAMWIQPTEDEEEKKKYLDMGEIAYGAEKQQEAMKFIRAHPLDFVRFSFRRFATTWTATEGPIADAWRVLPWSNRLLFLLNCAFSLLAFLGLWLATRTLGRDALPFAIAVFVFPLVYYVTVSFPRYRHPINPILTVLVVYAVVLLFSRVSQAFSAPWAAAVAHGRSGQKTRKSK